MSQHPSNTNNTEAMSSAPQPVVEAAPKRKRGRPRSNPNDPKWLNAPTPVARPATAKRGIPKDDDDFKPSEYLEKRAEERVPAQPRKSKRARTLVYESLDQEVIMAKALGEIPEPLDNARAPAATQEPTPPPSLPTSGESSPKDSIVVPAKNPSGHHHHHHNDNNKNNNDERFGRGYRASRLPTPSDSSPDNDDNKKGRMGPPPPPPRRSGLLSPSPESPPNPARVPSSVPAAPVPVARVPVAPAPVVRAPVARVPAARAPAVPAPVVPAPIVPAPIAAAPAVPAPIAAPVFPPAQVPAVNPIDLDPLGIGAALMAEMDAFIDDGYLQPFEVPRPYVNQWDAWRQPEGPFNAWVQPERNFFREAMAAHPRGGMCAACMARYGNGFDVLEELFPAFGQQPCCWAWPGNQFMGAQ